MQFSTWKKLKICSFVYFHVELYIFLCFFVKCIFFYHKFIVNSSKASFILFWKKKYVFFGFSLFFSKKILDKSLRFKKNLFQLKLIIKKRMKNEQKHSVPDIERSKLTYFIICLIGFTQGFLPSPPLFFLIFS